MRKTVRNESVMRLLGDEAVSVSVVYRLCGEDSRYALQVLRAAARDGLCELQRVRGWSRESPSRYAARLTLKGRDWLRAEPEEMAGHGLGGRVAQVRELEGANRWLRGVW